MKVLITTSGVGSKLGYLTKFMNKAMIKLGKKPVISYIIEQYPEDFEFIISLGYFGDHIRQFLKLCYPGRNFIFVEVDNYNGEGSSQAYSMLCCKEYLNEPFIYNDCDTIVNNLGSFINNFDFKDDFVCGYKIESLKYHTNYDAYNVSNWDHNLVTDMFKKGENTLPTYAYIGICGIYDYEYFWKCLKEGINNKTIKSDFDVFLNYYNHQKNLINYEVNNWKDTGNVDNIIHYRNEIEDNLNILDKNDQSIFIFKNFVIKFFTNDKTVKNIVNRHKDLGNLTHKITEHTTNFFKYDFIKGDTSIHWMNPYRFKNMMSYFKKNNLWLSIDLEDPVFFEVYKKKFYIDKTIQRIETFKKEYNIKEDKDIFINDILIPKEYTIEYMLSILSEQDEYVNSNATSWHGDFTLENIIYNEDENKYTLIDCRDKFGDTVLFGDKLYDFGKMNHNLTFNFDNAISGKYNLSINNSIVRYSILVDSEVYKCKETLKEFLNENYPDIRYDYIEALSGLCWLNMSPLHKIGNMPLLLFYMGKLKLYESIKKLEKKYEDNCD